MASVNGKWHGALGISQKCEGRRLGQEKKGVGPHVFPWPQVPAFLLYSLELPVEETNAKTSSKIQRFVFFWGVGVGVGGRWGNSRTNRPFTPGSDVTLESPPEAATNEWDDSLSRLISPKKPRERLFSHKNQLTYDLVVLAGYVG